MTILFIFDEFHGVQNFTYHIEHTHPIIYSKLVLLYRLYWSHYSYHTCPIIQSILFLSFRPYSFSHLEHTCPIIQSTFVPRFRAYSSYHLEHTRPIIQSILLPSFKFVPQKLRKLLPSRNDFSLSVFVPLLYRELFQSFYADIFLSSLQTMLTFFRCFMFYLNTMINGIPNHDRILNRS